MFVSLDDSAVPLLENAKGIRKLVVISRQLSEKGAEQLQQHFGKDNVDCPKGALLGVTANQADGDNWRVTSVLEGSAAAKAGILEGDRIAKYNGQEITDFRSLRAYISKNEPGDAVTMEIERGLEKLTKQVVFGEWD
jgi:S1-C subfamily serine protease